MGKDSVVVTLRLSRADYEMLSKEAEEHRIGLGAYMRQLALARRGAPRAVDEIFEALSKSRTLRLRLRGLVNDVTEG